MNLHVITPTDLKSFQLENYKEMLLKPRDEKHEKFLKNQIKLLNGNLFTNAVCDPLDSVHYSPFCNGTQRAQKSEQLKEIFGRP